jgi:hypothetical protein
MSALGISPAVMINRVVHEARAPGNHLMQVAIVRADVVAAAQHEQARQTLVNPAAETRPAAVVTGADVDRLV